jgi:tRNA (cmo5U34)-methyltransferase
MSEDHVWDPDSYMDVVAAEIPGYGELQDRTAEACAGLDARTLLELGVGTAETARRVRLLYPSARLTAVDSSAEMLEAARGALPAAELQLARLEDPLPEGPFDLVYSALAVHHLDAAAKRDLFRRVFDVLGPGGAFVLADLVVAADPADQRIAVDWEMDVPDLLADQLEWLGEAGFDAAVFWEDRDLAIVRAFRR